MEDSRLTHLLNLYLDAALSPAEKEELQQILMESEVARQSFWEHSTLHALTHEAAKLKWAEQPVEAPANDPTVPWWCFWTWSWQRAVAFSIPLLLMVGLLAAVLHRSFFSNKPVATLARAVDAQWVEDDRHPGTNTLLSPGWLNLRSGAVAVEFHGGARLLVEGPAEFRLDSESRMFCSSGQFSAIAPARARGFTMSWPEASAVDLGTKFGLILPPDGEAELHVFSGLVEVQETRPDAVPLGLREGEAVRLRGGDWDRTAASSRGFLSQEDLDQRELPEVRLREAAWRAASAALNEDPATLLHFTFRDQPVWERVVTNQANSAPPETHGIIVGAEWTEGQWPGRKALELTGKTNRVRLELRRQFQEFTCLVWVQVDALPNGFVHSLLTGDSEQPGCVRWTISHLGQIRLGLANPSSGAEASWSVAVSSAVVKEELLGRWLMLVSVYDGKTAFHYLDGKQIWSGALKSPGQLSFNWVELGNWVATPDSPEFEWAKGRAASFFARNFNGRFGEVAVLSRPMSAEEIQRLYEASHP